MVSRAWKALPEDEREEWEVMARQDKARYEMEKSMYTGPWKVPATKRQIKDPTAPKRPMSAFLSFSNSKRAYVKSKNKDAKNAEVSRLLAQMWKDADAEEKKLFVDEEFALRQHYKMEMAEWKRESEEAIEMKRKEREDEAMRAVREGKLPTRNDDSKNSNIGNTVDPAASTELKYNTKIANETFGQASFPSPSQSSSNINRAQQNLGFSGDYTQQNQHQHYPLIPSSYYNPNQQTSLDSYENNNIVYRNTYAAYQAHGSSTGGYDGYDSRRFEAGGVAMGYDSFGQPHPYGYLPQAYYQQGMYNCIIYALQLS